MIRAFFKNWKAPGNCPDDQILRWLDDGGKAAEDRALDCLYRRMGPVAAAWATKNGGDEDDGLTALAEALFKFVDAFRRGLYRHDGKLEAYIMRIAMRKHLDALRKKGRTDRYEKLLGELPPGPAAQTGAGDDDELETGLSAEEEAAARRYEQAVPLLDADCRERLDLFFIKKWRQRDIAERFNITEGSVKTSIYRCMEKLRKLAGIQPEN